MSQGNALWDNPEHRGENGLVERSIENAGLTLVDGKVVATYDLVVCLAGLGRFIPRQIVVVATSITDSTQCTISVGTNAASYDNMLAATVLTFTGANRVRTFDVADDVAGIPTAAAGDTITLNVSVAAIGTGNMTLDVRVIGYYRGN